jgi:hypothetical protein
MRTALACAIVLIAFFLPSCRQSTADNNFIKPLLSTYSAKDTTSEETPEKNIIFYGILSPVEICAIFERLGIPYNNAALNPVTRKDLYLSSSKTAINTGIYGVDFGYLKMFGAGQEMFDYLLAIKEMSYNLGIPEEVLIMPVEKLQGSIADSDTITAIVSSTYRLMDEHLRSSGRESTAGLIIMGGWVEAVFLATQLVYDPLRPDLQVIQKIAEQKYTLNALLTLLKNYYDDPVVVYYSKKLKYLKRYFDSIEIYYKKEDLEIDHEHKFLRSSGSDLSVTTEIISSIRDYVNKLRTEMVTP